MTDVQRIPVPLDADRSYDVHVGAGARHHLAEVIRATVPRARRAAVVTEPGILAALSPGGGLPVDPGIGSRVDTIPGGEDTKDLTTIGRLCSAWSAWGLTRNDVVVGLGGGLVTDVAGFAAATYHRGTAVVHVPTTLLGMIDAAIGGKTGVNIPEGKNLVGAFWQPSAVLCDPELLSSLPARELRGGLGEMAKYHVIDPVRLPLGADGWPIAERIAACAAIKAEIVSGDEREGGRRAVLNYGHTLGHALEIATGFELRHGEAVAIGMVFAAELGGVLGRIDRARIDAQRRLVASYDLATTLPAGLDERDLIALMARDKKATDGLTFVLDGPCGVETVTGVTHAELRAAFHEMRCRA
jgi:5-deoxy-5-amino-3-dehydroquinate synthase